MDHLPPSPVPENESGAATNALLIRYLAGAVAPTERILVQQMLSESPELAAFVSALRESQQAEDASATSSLARGRELLVARVGFAPQLRHLSIETTQAADRTASDPGRWATDTLNQTTNESQEFRIQSETHQPEQVQSEMGTRHLPRSRQSAQGTAGRFAVRSSRGWFAAITAALVIAFGMTFLGWEAGVRQNRPSSASVLSYATNPGQRATITLPDGSIVSLGVASRLDVSANYGHGHREVRLQGEALFNVAPRTQAPFVVMTDSTPVRVLGTSFVVRDYATDSAVLVAVRQGKVAVHSVVVAAQQEVEVNHQHVGRVHPVRLGRFSFATGVLTLTDMPLASAIPELNRWYAADIRLGDPQLSAHRISAKLPAGSLTDLAAILETTFHVRVVREGQVLTLYPR
jgi:ferric-dicitrate binding protein FerR (iron transport regulator)